MLNKVVNHYLNIPILFISFDERNITQRKLVFIQIFSIKTLKIAIFRIGIGYNKFIYQFLFFILERLDHLFNKNARREQMANLKGKVARERREAQLRAERKAAERRVCHIPYVSKFETHN